MIVMIDPGHGGRDPGAVGPQGTKEKDVTWPVSLYLKEELQRRGHVAILTHDGSESELGPRVRFTNRQKLDCLISIHCNSAASPAARGFEIFTSPGITRADSLATAIFTAVQEHFPCQVMRPDYSDGDPDKEARFYMLTHTVAPAVLAELDFINNPAREVLLRDPQNQRKIAEVLAIGICNWYAAG
jgi:N-acetylmuramoyl-L-alanine amidase